MIKEWKWSIGEPYYKSARKQEVPITQKELNYDTSRNAINQSLDQDSFLDDSNIREDIDTKMANRSLITQRGVNPFLQTSYVNDIVTRDMYLKPINTTQGRTKQEETNN